MDTVVNVYRKFWWIQVTQYFGIPLAKGMQEMDKEIIHSISFNAFWGSPTLMADYLYVSERCNKDVCNTMMWCVCSSRHWRNYCGEFDNAGAQLVF